MGKEGKVEHETTQVTQFAQTVKTRPAVCCNVSVLTQPLLNQALLLMHTKQ